LEIGNAEGDYAADSSSEEEDTPARRRAHTAARTAQETKGLVAPVTAAAAVAGPVVEPADAAPSLFDAKDEGTLPCTRAALWTAVLR
jgi:hypothetical protein